jgi:hypothetical protein
MVTYAVEGTFGVDKRKGTRNIDISSALQLRTFWSDKNVFKIKLDIIDNSHGWCWMRSADQHQIKRGGLFEIDK